MNVENIVPMRLPPRTPRPRAEPHVTVLRSEVVEALSPREGGVYLDVTLGAGGHAEAILEVPGTRVLGVDRDQSALALARVRLAPFGERVTFLHGRFSTLKELLAAEEIAGVDGLVADLGVSSMQLDDAARGMSFRAEGPLDMRMDPSSGSTALDLIDELDDDDLADVIYRYGEERRSRRVARCIKQARASGELHTSLDLRRAVVRAVGPARIGGVDPATRTFQALRIAVNAELEEIERLLSALPELVKAGGVVAIIAFHSLEDRLVKRALRDRVLFRPLTKKPQVPSDEEMNENPRSRSAKLRAAERISGEGTAPDSDDERDSNPGSDPGAEWYVSGLGREGGGVKQRPFLALWTLATLATVLAFVVHLGLRGRTVDLGYKLGRARAEQARLREVKRVLSLEAASFEAPQRVEHVAQTLLGMSPPPPERVISLKGYSPTAPSEEKADEPAAPAPSGAPTVDGGAP